MRWFLQILIEALGFASRDLQLRTLSLGITIERGRAALKAQASSVWRRPGFPFADRPATKAFKWTRYYATTGAAMALSAGTTSCAFNRTCSPR
jgi:hypothetical protein